MNLTLTLTAIRAGNHYRVRGRLCYRGPELLRTQLELNIGNSAADIPLDLDGSADIDRFVPVDDLDAYRHVIATADCTSTRVGRYGRRRYVGTFKPTRHDRDVLVLTGLH